MVYKLQKNSREAGSEGGRGGERESGGRRNREGEGGREMGSDRHRLR